MQLHVPAPPDAGGNWSADLEAQLWRAQQDLDTVGVAVFLDAVMAGSCVPPCAVLLKGVTQGDHMVRAAPATSASHNVSASQLLRFRLLRLHAQASSQAVAVDAVVEAVESGTDPEVLQLQDSAPAVPSTRGGDTTAELPPADPLEDGRYVSILYPTDDTCFTERSVDYYVSAAVTDGFFRLPHAHNIIARFEATVHCITTPEDMKASWGGVIMPAPMSYDPKTHGALMKCHWYESEFTLKDGWVRREDGQLAINGQHDCPRGTVCKHDLEDGFMIDIGLVVKEECCAISVRISFTSPSPCPHPKLAFTFSQPPPFLSSRSLPRQLVRALVSSLSSPRVSRAHNAASVTSCCCNASLHLAGGAGGGDASRQLGRGHARGSVFLSGWSDQTAAGPRGLGDVFRRPRCGSCLPGGPGSWCDACCSQAGRRRDKVG